MKEFVEFLIKKIVRNPDSVKIEENADGSNLHYQIEVDPSDMGLIIGKEGRTINSIRSLAKAKAVKENIWVDINIKENEVKQ